jgi:Reverse transcriptase (RNA-dependent DNA polymerase)
MRETKKIIFKHFDMKDLDEASYVLGLKIHRDQNKSILRLSQQTYIDKILKRYDMENYKQEIPLLLKETNPVLISAQKQNLRNQKCIRFHMLP